jgi:hypothetical protein
MPWRSLSDLSPADVRIVINTHLHTITAGGTPCSSAPFYVQRAGWVRPPSGKLTSEWFDFAGALRVD